MKINNPVVPDFYLDTISGMSGNGCRELLRRIDIRAGVPEVFVWLKQLRVAPYSYDWLDNRGRKSPGYVIENIPPLRVNAHYLLAFHVYAFEENSYIVCRFCEPINPPVNLYMKDLFMEYRVVEEGTHSTLWCKIKGHFNNDTPSKGFFMIFATVNKIMMSKQLRNIRWLSERLAAGKIETKTYDFSNYFTASGIHWWIFCRRRHCKGLIT